MKILNIVSSNIVQDPRILKQMETIQSVTNDYKVIGMNNANATEERLSRLNFNYQLIGESNQTTSIVSKLMKRINFAKGVIHEIKMYQPDVIHANDFDVLLMVYLSGNKNAKLIFDAHEIYAKNAFINKYKPISKVVEMIEKHIIKKRVNAFITVSHAAKSYYQQRKYSKPAHVITNVPFLDENRTYRDVESIKEIVYQGQIVGDRGYEEFVEASKYFEIGHPLFKIRGFGPLEEQIRKIVQSNPANVRIEKPVEVSQLVDKLTESDIGVVLTKPVSINFEYTVSNKIFECIHAGLPVILSPVKEHCYLNEKYQFGIVIDEVTTEHIANAIKQLIENPDRYYELRENAIDAAQILNWNQVSKQLIELYKH